MDLVHVQELRPARSRADLRLAPGEVLLAGGSWLFSQPQPHCRGLVDLTALGWRPWEPTPGRVRLAATCTVAELLEAAPEALGAAAPLARACADALALSFKVQSVATLGGNVCLALPAGALTALVVALDGEAVVWTPDGRERREPVADLVRGPGRTSLAPGEVLRAVDLPARALQVRTASRRTSLAALGRSAALVLGRVEADGTTVVTVTASTSRPVVLRFPVPPASTELERALAEVDCWYDDPHGAPDWRRAVTGVLAEQVRAELAA